MAFQSRVAQDRRNTSRVVTRLDCQIAFDGGNHKAVIINLSMKGAFISAQCLPPNGSIIKVALQPPVVKHDLLFEAMVVRGHWAMSEHGKLGRFGIRFAKTPPEILLLFSKLSS